MKEEMLFYGPSGAFPYGHMRTSAAGACNCGYSTGHGEGNDAIVPLIWSLILPQYFPVVCRNT